MKFWRELAHHACASSYAQKGGNLGERTKKKRIIIKESKSEKAKGLKKFSNSKANDFPKAAFLRHLNIYRFSNV